MSCCNTSCLCKCIVISQSVSFANNELAINLPAGAYENGGHYCLVIAQEIPAETTIAANVVITIGTDTTTTYPLVNGNCVNVQAYQISSRTKYPTTVATNVGEGVFKLNRNINCIKCSSNAAPALPIQTTTETNTTDGGEEP